MTFSFSDFLISSCFLRKPFCRHFFGGSCQAHPIVGDNGMGALTYSPAVILEREETVTDFDRLQQIALEVLKRDAK
mgnify:CR=1 FL=1